MGELIIESLETQGRLGDCGLPLTVLRDCRIRQAMSDVVQYEDDQVTEITKELQQQEHMVLLHSAVVQRPFSLPSAVMGGASSTFGTDNEVMRAFAFDAYEALDTYFGDRRWCHWLIAPYFAAGDDLRTSMYIGVFAKDFAETVVE